MIRLAFYIRDSQGIDRRHVPRVSEAIRGSSGIEKATSLRREKKVSTFRGPPVKIQPRKACNYPNLRSDGWVSYDKVGVLYSGKLGNRSEARASDLKSYPGLWWNRIKIRLSTKAKKIEYPPRTCSIGKPAGGTLCPHQ